MQLSSPRDSSSLSEQGEYISLSVTEYLKVELILVIVLAYHIYYKHKYHLHETENFPKIKIPSELPRLHEKKSLEAVAIFII